MLVVAWGVAVLTITATGYAAQRQEFRRTFDLRPGATVSLENISGDITIDSWAKSQVHIAAEKVGPSHQLEEVDISIDAQPSRLEIRTRYPRKGNLRVSVHYRLTVPRTVNLDSIKSVSGEIDISDIEGWVVASSVSGSVAAKRIGQDVDLHTVSGDAGATDVSGRASVKSVSGDVDVRNVKGDVEASSVSGSVVIRGAQAHIEASSVSSKISITESTPSGLKASTTSGSIRFQGRLASSARYTLRSHSGTVTVLLPADSSFALEASTFSGSIDTDFPVRLQGSIGKRKLAGVVGDGGPTLELQSFSGSIRLRKSGS